MGTKAKIKYVCQECGAESPKWQGKCPDCDAWNAYVETLISDVPKPASRMGYAGAESLNVQPLGEVEFTPTFRISTAMSEFDRVLGGGVVPGSVVLIGGDPGIGKSSILLQVMCECAANQQVLYVTGEESAEQVALRAKRMDLPTGTCQLITGTDVEGICRLAEETKPQLMVVDSIQTMHLGDIPSAPGGVAQVRESATRLTRMAKQHNIAIFLVGHVTKSGEVAGPRVLEHVVDVVLLIEGSTDSRYRMMRAVKNRFGAINEVGVFAMTDKGMKPVQNPSAIFLSRAEHVAPGSAVMNIWEGSRPLLVELQALVDSSQYGPPRRVAVGCDQNRINMLLAILHRHAGIQVSDQDVYINVVGGVKVTETSADLAILCAIVSSLKNRPLPQDLIVFGEVGLSGEIRPVAYGMERVEEAAKHGFKKAVVPKANVSKKSKKAIEIVGVTTLADALSALF